MMHDGRQGIKSKREMAVHLAMFGVSIRQRRWRKAMLLGMLSAATFRSSIMHSTLIGGVVASDRTAFGKSLRPLLPARLCALQEDETAGVSKRGDAEVIKSPEKVGVSKTEMLKFALPALGIYLADPLMSNMDNAFVGRFSGTTALAALGPGTVFANNLMFLFASVLNSATTGLVARAWAGGSGDDPAGRARSQLGRTMSIAWVVGLGLTAFYSFATPWALRAMGTPAGILPDATTYARIRGFASWAAVAQGVCLSALLATRDTATPLRVVVSAQAVNFAGDFLLCCWPLRTGVAGAAAATAVSTLVGFSLMVRALRRRQLFPQPRLPSWSDALPVLEYAGPLFVITGARIIGFTAMSFTAAALGTAQLAAYQVIISLFVVFVFVSGPLSQNAQTLLPPLVDKGDKRALRRAFGNIFILASIVGAITALLYLITIRFGGTAFTSDGGVLREVVAASLSSFVSAATLLVLSAVDGALTAAKDFNLIVIYQVIAVAVQLLLLAEVRRSSLGLSFVFLSLTVRLWICAFGAAFCILSGIGRLGGALRGRKV